MNTDEIKTVKIVTSGETQNEAVRIPEQNHPPGGSVWRTSK